MPEVPSGIENLEPGSKAYEAWQAIEQGDLLDFHPEVLNIKRFELNRKYSPKEAKAVVERVLKTNYYDDYDIAQVIADARELVPILRTYPNMVAPFEAGGDQVNAGIPPSYEGMTPPHPYHMALVTIMYKLGPNPSTDEHLREYAEGHLRFINWDYKASDALKRRGGTPCSSGAYKATLD